MRLRCLASVKGEDTFYIEAGCTHFQDEGTNWISCFEKKKKREVVACILLYLELCFPPMWRCPRRDICWCSYRSIDELTPFETSVSVKQTPFSITRCHIPRILALFTSSAFWVFLNSLLHSVSVFITVSKVINIHTISKSQLLPSTV